MKKQKSIPTLKKELSILISRYIKLLYCIDGRYAYCFTCGQKVGIDTSFCQAGHCFSRAGYPALQFKTNNIRVQCEKCNITLNGAEKVFKERLLDEIGVEQFSYLESHKNDTVKLDREKMQEEIATYKLLIGELLNN